MVIRVAGEPVDAGEFEELKAKGKAGKELQDELDLSRVGKITDLSELQTIRERGGPAAGMAKDRIRDVLRGSKVERHLGDGSFGSVDLMEAPDGTKLAVKKAHEPRHVDDLRKEARIYEEIGEHPNIAKCYGLVDDVDGVKLVMKPIMGDELSTMFTDLNRALSGNVITQVEFEGVVAHLMRGMLRGLKALSDKGYVHHDIKGGNVMLDLESMEAIVIDVGGATKEGEGGYSYTPGYSDHRSLDEKADVFAVGSTTYTAREGKGLMDRARKYFAGISDNRLRRLEASRAIASGAVKPVDPDAPTTAYVSYQRGMMNPDAGKRFTLDEALAHPFLGDSVLSPDEAKGVLGKLVKRRDGKQQRAQSLLDKASRIHVAYVSYAVGEADKQTRMLPIEARRTCKAVVQGTTPKDALDELDSRRVAAEQLYDAAQRAISERRILLGQLAAEGYTQGSPLDELAASIEKAPRLIEVARKKLAMVKAIVQSVRDGSYAETWGAPQVPAVTNAELALAEARLALGGMADDALTAIAAEARLKELAKAEDADAIDVADATFEYEQVAARLPEYRTQQERWREAASACEKLVTGTFNMKATRVSKALKPVLAEVAQEIGRATNAVEDAKVHMMKLGPLDEGLTRKRTAAIVSASLKQLGEVWAESKAAVGGELDAPYKYANLDKRVLRGMTTVEKLTGKDPVPEKAALAMSQALQEATTICEARVNTLSVCIARFRGPLLGAVAFMEDLDPTTIPWDAVAPSVTSYDDALGLATRIEVLRDEYIVLRDKGLVALESPNAFRGSVLELAKAGIAAANGWKLKGKTELAELKDEAVRLAAAVQLCRDARTTDDHDTVRGVMPAMPEWKAAISKGEANVTELTGVIGQLTSLEKWTDYSFQPTAAKLRVQLQQLVDAMNSHLDPMARALSQLEDWELELPMPDFGGPEPSLPDDLPGLPDRTEPSGPDDAIQRAQGLDPVDVNVQPPPVDPLQETRSDTGGMYD